MILGAITSGLGYAVWYGVLKDLSTSRAAMIQLTVLVIAAVAGVIFIGEQSSWRLALATLAIVGGVALALLGSRPTESPAQR
jgi:drug/metabolite transporter (DMT)-like permease